LKIPGAELRIGLTISKTDSGAYSATMNSIDQGSGEIPMDETRFTRNRQWTLLLIGLMTSPNK